jgi:hypothetical protein
MDCQCITDPLDVYSTICGYINKKNGLVYPCTSDSCLPQCEHVGVQPIINQGFRPSGDGILPSGFNVNLPQSDQPTVMPNEVLIEPIDYKVWNILLTLLLLLCLIIFVILLLLST